MDAIRTQGLTKDYGGHRGIFDLDLTVPAGEAFGLIGPNGAGKTTTLRLLMDLIRPTRGRAEILGMDTQRDSVAVKRVVGYLPAEGPDYPNHTGARILDLLAHLRGGVDAQRISELARTFELDLGRRYREYSHGNKQKVWLIQAFMHDPQVLILDEPTTGLDPLMQQAFRDLIAQARRRGATIFLSSHVLPEVQEICDRIGVVHAGSLRQVGTLDELRFTHRHRVEAQVAREVSMESLASVPGIADIEISDHHVRCTVSGAMDPLLDTLRESSILSLESSEMSLEEMFIAEYGRAAAH